ncbi:DNA polymerase beta superfamily protein [Bacillus songklensis]|uniref:DNA polymerase beta superfamily protein n=1 Tax=Bacillus songklensis TaxID=1069116 RepID=A0ABV8B4A9_9BACI
MEQTIKQHLHDIGKLNGIQILYACEAGSRAYGLHTEKSDYDVRFIFKQDVSEYLMLQSPTEVMNDHSIPGVDIQGWDLYKAMHLFTKSNPSLYEWMYSPIVYQENTTFSIQLREYIRSQYSLKKLGFHYLRLMKSNLKKRFSQPITMGDIKICLHVMRAYLSLQIMLKEHLFPPLSFDELFGKGIFSGDVAENIALLRYAKTKDTFVEKEVCLSLMTFADQQLPFLKEQVEGLGEGSIDREKINQWIISLHNI